MAPQIVLEARPYVFASPAFAYPDRLAKSRQFLILRCTTLKTFNLSFIELLDSTQ